MYRTIREKNTSIPMPAQLALPMAGVWDWLASKAPLRGPLMFSTDYIQEMQVGHPSRAAWCLWPHRIPLLPTPRTSLVGAPAGRVATAGLTRLSLP